MLKWRVMRHANLRIFEIVVECVPKITNMLECIAMLTCKKP